TQQGYSDAAGTTFGAVWHWAGSSSGGNLAAGQTGGGPLKSPAADSAGEYAYNVGLAGGAGTPVRRSFENPTTETDQRNLWGQGMPVGRPSVAVCGSRAGTPAPLAWAAGLTTTPGVLGPVPVESRFEFSGTVD